MKATQDAEVKEAGVKARREHHAHPRETQQIEELLSLMAQATEREVVFEFAAQQDSRVFIAGTFNGWNPTTHPLDYHPESGLFRATLLLEPGVHEYKFVVDGAWHVDVKCPHWVLNDNGTINSVIRV